ncbi:MAG: hypothetical protein OEV66_11400 [Spirochaetia bacterium]|nr:hypothetical protein [Spirochaetia bacterium]
MQALLRYEKKFNIDDIDNLVYKVFSYYRKSANLYRKSGKVAEAWNAFLPLIQLILNLEPKGIAPHVVESTSLHTFIDLDEMLLKFNDNQTIHAVLDFYKTNIEFARKNTINSFIFGRAYLNTMYGIKLHRNFEANRELNKENKETVLTYFFEAEEDFQWSIYADATFADAYIMLGWMYQFIDEKRDTDVYTSKIGNEMKKDKNIFSSLYKKYFPDYLYEKNIELYQKSLTYLPLDSNPEVIQSIRLNLANNYFLLNNYAKAEENYSNITLTGKNKYLFNSKVQEAQFYFHFGKAGFFLGHYNDALVRLDKSLQYYNARSPKKLPEKTIVYFQKSAILKYLAMSASNAGKYDKAVEYYREVINASKGTSINDNLSMIYLEISRNLLEQMNLTHNLHRSSEALSTLDLAEADIRKFPVIKSPRYPTKFKIFGLDLFNFNMPWFSEPDDVFKGGDNHLAYKMPTLNQLEYLHSIRADIYKIIGGYSKSAFALAQLVEEAGRDDTKHGRQTLLSALMRSGELQFIAGDMKGARDKYELALKKAIDADNMKIYYLAAKNLMAIACREIDLGKSSLEKHKLAAQHLKELDSFKNQYVKLETDKAEEELKDKNPHIKLTISEKAKIEKDAISKISRILIYRGIFEAYSLMYGDNPSAKQKATDLAAYYQNAEKNYQSNKNVLYSLDGFAKIQGEDIKLYDQKKDRRLSMILDLDKGLVYESMGELDKAMDIYKETYDKAYEFKANEFLIVSGFRYYSLAHMAGKNDAYKVLQKIDSTLKLYPYLAKKRQEIFREISNAMIQENLKNKQYMNTIYLANFNRVIKLKKILESMLSSLDENLANELNDYKELEKVEEILAADIENLKIQRESTDSLDSIMEQLLKEKVKIKNAILKNPKLSGYAYALFPDLLSVNDIINIKASYLYIIENESGTNFIYKYPDQNNFETRTFALTSKSVEEFLTHEDSSPEKPSIQNMPVEFKNFISWIKNKNISIIYPDVNYMSFPFSKYTQNNAPRDFTVQSTLLFSKNTNITATRFIQNGKFGIPVENPLNMPDVTSISSNKNPDNWYNGIDFEITQKDFNGNSPVFREIIERRSPSALSIFSYSIEDKSQLVLYTSAVNILLAASNSTTAIHLTGARSAMGNTVAKIIEGNIKNKDNIIYSGNTDISGSLINRSSPDSARILSRYQKVELETCDLFTLKQSRDFQYDSALNNIEKCNDIYNNMETKLMQGKNSKDITTAKVPPDFHRFLSKVNILLDSGTDSNLLQVPKEFQLFKDKTSLDDGSLPLAFNQQALKYITLLLGADQEEMAFNVFKILPAEFHYTKANYFSILESYYLGKLFSGNLTAFLNDPPETLKNIPEKNSLTDEKLPENLSERIRYFMKGTLQKDKWIQAMTISGEYKNAIAYLQNGISTLSLWQKIDYLISTNKRENFPFNDPALLSLKKLMSFESTPAEYDKIIESFAGDQALKNFAGIIRNIKSSQITEKDIADSFLKNISENDRDGFYKKQTLINYLVQFIDSEKNSELANKNLLTVISGCSFGKSIKNRQQKLYADISGSVNALGSTTEKLNDLIKNGNNGVSFANSAFIGQLIAISVNLNPFEGLKMASQNTSFLGVGQQETFSRLENLLKQDNGIKDITYADFSFMEKYYIMAHENEKALSTYFSFDRNQKPEKFAFEKNLSGIFMINSDEYYSWTWSQNKATINRISEAEISKTLASFADNINYIPSKDKRLRDLILSRESGLKYFSATASPEQTLQDVTSKISWDYDSANTPGYSIMKIWLPDPDKNTNSESNATDIGYYGKKSGSSRINFQDDPVNITQIEALMNIHKSGYHILFTNQSSYNMYLTLMKEFINQSRDEIQKPMELFGKVLKNLGKLYPNNENLNNIIMVEN